MKKYFNYTVLPLLALSGVLSSCELDEINPGAGDATVSSYDGWRGLQTYCYSSLNDQLYTASDWMFVSETGTDLWLAKGNGDGYKQVFNYEETTPSTNNIQKLWKQCYAMITNCNTVINEAPTVTDGNPDEIKVLVAETKTLRALYYSILVAHFGPVSLVTESSSSLTGDIQLYPKRASEKDIYDFIITDLTEAIPDLGVASIDGNRARFTKKSAIGLLARVYAQRAGLGQSKFGDADKYWRLAADTAEDLITNAESYGAYLYPDIADMWADANNRSNREALMIAAGADAGTASWNIASKPNKLAAYSCGGCYSEFWSKNHKPGDKGYFYGRLNSQNWMPSEYLMYCFNPEWDRRWEYSFQHAWCEWTMMQCGWVDYTAGVFTYTADAKLNPSDAANNTNKLFAKHDINPGFLGESIFPYADCDGRPAGYSANGNQFPAKVWPKDFRYNPPVKPEATGNKELDKENEDKYNEELAKYKQQCVKRLLTVAPSSAQINQEGYSGSTKVYAIPYPVDPEDRRFNTIFVHEPMSPEDHDKCICPVVVLRDLYGSNGLPYGNLNKGSEAGNPPNIGNGKTSSSVYPSLIKFNWSYDGCFYAGNLQVKTGDMFIMRMAEVYLIAAEAEQMLGNGDKAAGYINDLRQRSVRPGVPESMWKLSTATEDDIFDEYARELCGEFSRWALLKRHNAFESRLQRYNVRAFNVFRPHHYNRPVSADFLDTILNKEEYGDNGYGYTSRSGLEDFK